jgi:hypothetical protein
MVSALELAVESAVTFSWAEVDLFLCISSVYPDIVRCHYGNERHPSI